MEGSVESLARVIGARVKDERRAREWSLDKLSQEAGLSRRMVINVEQGAVNPSVGTLLRLSDALGIGLPGLVEPPPPSSAAQITRHGDGAVLWNGEFGGCGVLVAGTQPPNVLELWDWTMHPGETHRSGSHSAGTRELLHVIDGAMVVEVGDSAVQLAVGDALNFLADLEHAYTNPYDHPVRFALTVLEPGVGSNPTMERN